MNDVADRLSRVEQEIAHACAQAARPRSAVRLVAVSKKQPIERVRAAYDAGCRDFGENYVQELEQRIQQLPRDARVHMIGHVQTNKAKRVVQAAMIHTIDSEKLARTLARATTAPIRVLIEVNIANETNKSGVPPDDVEKLVESVRTMPELSLGGLMCIPPPGEGRRYFRALFALKEVLTARTGLELPDLSMGMSGDFADAILEGATIVRVGTAIFGERQTG